MAGSLILLVAGVYFLTAISLFIKGNGGMAVAFFSYGVSNIGLFYAS